MADSGYFVKSQTNHQTLSRGTAILLLEFSFPFVRLKDPSTSSSMIFERRNVGVLSGKDVASAKLEGDKDLRMQAGKQLKVPPVATPS